MAQRLRKKGPQQNAFPGVPVSQGQAAMITRQLLEDAPKMELRPGAEMLEQTIRRYQIRAVEAAQVIEELGLSEEELAFYDALGVNDSAVRVLGDETLRDIARELVETVRGNVTIDWTLRENVRANLRRLVKRVLRQHGYPPDKQETATRTVLEQAEVLSAGWAV